MNGILIALIIDQSILFNQLLDMDKLNLKVNLFYRISVLIPPKISYLHFEVQRLNCNLNFLFYSSRVKQPLNQQRELQK